MRPPEKEVVRKIVGDWLQKADVDFRAAEVLLKQVPPLACPSCFHSQQAAEKYLKAYLTRHQVEFPKTHSIRQILDLVATAEAALARELQPATALTPYGVDVRYPQDAPEPSLSDAQQAIQLARQVRDAVTKRLQLEP